MKKIITAFLTLIILFGVNTAASAKVVILPELNIIEQPIRQYSADETISFKVQAPNYGGKVEYRVILYNGTTKTTTNLWNTPATGYYYRNWQPSGNYVFQIRWSASQLKPGAYSMTVLVRRANSNTYYDSYVDTNSFYVTDPSQNDAAAAAAETNGEPLTIPEDFYNDAGSVLIYPDQTSTEIISMQFFKNLPYTKVNNSQDLKKVIENNLLNFNNYMNLIIPANNAEMGMDEVKELLNIVLMDNYAYKCYIDSTQASYITVGGETGIRIQLGYNYSPNELVAMNREVDSKADEIIGQIITPSMTDYDKVKAIHDYIVNNTTYDSSLQPISYTIYGALIKGSGVCQAYTSAFEALLDKVGIENIAVVSESMEHAWSMVKLDGDYYHIDTTWDDPVTNTGENVLRYDYFLINDEEMKSREHVWEYNDYPQALGVKY